MAASLVKSSLGMSANEAGNAKLDLPRSIDVPPIKLWPPLGNAGLAPKFGGVGGVEGKWRRSLRMVSAISKRHVGTYVGSACARRCLYCQLRLTRCEHLLKRAQAGGKTTSTSQNVGSKATLTRSLVRSYLLEHPLPKSFGSRETRNRGDCGCADPKLRRCWVYYRVCVCQVSHGWRGQVDPSQAWHR
jgi:hypothetical protein